MIFIPEKRDIFPASAQPSQNSIETGFSSNPIVKLSGTGCLALRAV